MNNFNDLPERSEKSENSLVIGKAIVINPCCCVTCQNHYEVVTEAEVIILLGEIVNKPVPTNFHCPNCNSTYIKWGRLVITQ